MDEQKQTSRPFYKRKEFMYVAALVGVLAFLALSSRMTGRPPVVDSITPRIGYPEDVMVITGRFFGDARDGGQVILAGLSPVSSDYLEWSDNRISVRIPEDVISGMVRVVTKNGRSRGILFTNRDQIPVVLSGPGQPGQPYVQAVDPPAGPVGTLLTVSGMNFGLQRGSSRVLFTWVTGDQTHTVTADRPGAVEPASMLPAVEYDLDYAQWSDREIQVRIPDGASSGAVLVATDKGQSNAVYIEVEGEVGTKLFPEKRTYSVQYAIEVKDVVTRGPGSLYLWVPKVLEGPEQREIQLVAQEPEPLFDDVNGVKLFRLETPESGVSGRVLQSFMVDRYSVETKVNIARVPLQYDTARRLYKRYTVSDPLIPADAERIRELGAAIVGRERNPYRKAIALYNWVIRRLEPAPDSLERDILTVVDGSREGSSVVYSLLFCALARSTGVPARPVAGYLIDRELNSSRHYWAEFYVETVGWIPVDPMLGEGKTRVPLPPEVNPGQYYFGNLDFYHLALSKGIIELNQMDPAGRTIQRSDIPSLQRLHEEASGELESYTASWEDLKVLGVY
ncbi:MAG: transglutaminase [Spirochaetales bacterium]|nr:transglutaminase [Spirochaetales bacterium]